MKSSIFLIAVLLPLALFAAPTAPKVSAPAPVATVKPELRIAEDDLKGFEKGCVMGAAEDVPKEATANYCGCFKSRLAERVDRDAYRTYSQWMSSSSNQGSSALPEGFMQTENKMTELVKECSAFLAPTTDKKIR